MLGFTSLTGILFLILSLSSSQSGMRELVQGEYIEKEIAKGQTDLYRMTLNAGQHLRMVVNQRGIDVELKLLAPDGKTVVTSDQEFEYGREKIFLVAGAAGQYKLAVSTVESPVPQGRYDLKVLVLRAPTPHDQTCAAAEKALSEASRLRKVRTPEARQQASEKYEEAIALWRTANDPLWEAETLITAAGFYNNLGEFQKARTLFLQALPLWRSLGDQCYEATTLNNLGNLSIDLGEPRQAVEYYEQSLIPRQMVGDRRNEAITLNNLGNAWIDLGESQKALEHYHRALPLIRSLGSRREEAYSLNGMASVNLKLGLVQKALEDFNAALTIIREVKNRRHEAGLLQNIGLAYRTSGEFQKALEYYTEALPIAREVGDQFREAKLLNSISQIHRLLSEPQPAMQRLQEALLIARTINSRSLEADLLNSLGSLHAAQGEHSKAIDYYQQARTLWHSIEDRAREALALDNLAESWGALGKWPKALELFEQALPLSRATGDWNAEATALFGLARSKNAQGDLAQALVHIEAALEIVESVRGNVSSEDLRASFLASMRNLYEFRLELLMQLHKRRPADGFDAAALRASEAARARTLTEILFESRAEIRQGADAKLLAHERQLRQRINDKAQQIERLRGNKQGYALADSLSKEISSLLTEYEQTQTQLRTSSPRYAALTQPQPLSLGEIQQLLDEQTILLEYALGHERSYLWAVTPTSLESFELPARSVIKAAAKRAYELLLKSGQREFRVQSQLAIAELSRLVLSPVAGRLGRKRLLIVSDGALQYIPFGALAKPVVGGQSSVVSVKNSAHRPLIVEHEIVSLPSASILSVLRQEIKGRKQADLSVAVFADPVFRNDDQRVAQAVARKISGETQAFVAVNTQPGASSLVRSANETGVGELPRLPFTRQEAEAIASASGAQNNFKALDFLASRSTVAQAELSRYRILHFATHGLLNSQHPALSGLVLSLVDQNGQPQDGFLRLHDIYNLNLGAEMVVLSACRTALGQEVNGEGLIGLTRGFMFAGASRVVASLWDVKDEATAELMKRFYQKMLKEGRPPAAALREAQISMFREKRWEAPYYWASFTLQGEWK